MSTPFKLNKSPLELWPWGKKAKEKREQKRKHKKFEKLKKSISDKKASEASDIELMKSNE